MIFFSKKHPHWDPCLYCKMCLFVPKKQSHKPCPDSYEDNLYRYEKRHSGSYQTKDKVQRYPATCFNTCSH